MTTTEVFWVAARTAATMGVTGPRRLGSCLAWAGAFTLHADAGDITIAFQHGQPTPWGASHPGAAVAEQHQFTAGAGPTTQVLRTGRLMRATHSVIEQSWPGFAASLTQHTPYRSILAVPVARFAVLTVYYIDPDGCTPIDTATADLVANLIAPALIDDPELACLDDATSWPCLDGHPRQNVAIAVSILTAALHTDTDTALAVLRSRALASDRTVDDIAADLVNR